jgi:hypothetical protein
VSQPDKHPEGAPREESPQGHGVGPVGSPGVPAWFGWHTPGRVNGTYRRGRPPRERRERHEDLRGTPFPLGDWGDPAARLDELYRWAEDMALRTVDWYLADRVWKRRGARVLRAGSVLAAGAGVGLPAARLAGAPDALTGWGYLGLLAAVLCVGLDRWFGLTAGWMRDVATAQAVQRRLEALRFDWASESVREVLGPTEGTASEAAERCLAVLRRFCEDVSELVRGETAEWMVEFRAGAGPLYTQSLVAWGRRGDAGQQQNRFPLPPGGRPNMPRQRPPEGPAR